MATYSRRKRQFEQTRSYYQQDEKDPQTKLEDFEEEQSSNIAGQRCPSS